jgi:hypothetical protein
MPEMRAMTFMPVTPSRRPDRLDQHQQEVSQRQGNKQRQEKDGDS